MPLSAGASTAPASSAVERFSDLETVRGRDPAIAAELGGVVVARASTPVAHVGGRTFDEYLATRSPHFATSCAITNIACFGSAGCATSSHRTRPS